MPDFVRTAMRFGWFGVSALLIGSALTGCSSSSDDSSGPTYVNFEGSSNGQWVLDGNGSRVRFLMTFASTEFVDYLEWQGQTYNIYMNHVISTELYNGTSNANIGSVVLTAQGGKNVTALVGLTGHFLVLSNNSSGGIHTEENELTPTPPLGTAAGSTGSTTSDPGSTCTSPGTVWCANYSVCVNESCPYWCHEPNIENLACSTDAADPNAFALCTTPVTYLCN
jgi:hypothetical protein